MQTVVGYSFNPISGTQVNKINSTSLSPVSRALNEKSGDSVRFSSGWVPEPNAFSSKEDIKKWQNWQATLRAQAQKAGASKDTKDLRKITLKGNATRSSKKDKTR